MAKKNNLNDTLSSIAEASDFPETLSTAALNGKTFELVDARLVETMHGERFVGTLNLDGNTVEAWLSGSKLHQQVDAVVADGLPRTVCITKGEGQYDPYLLTLA